MTEDRLCDMCGKNVATKVCDECSVPLCEECVREVVIPDTGLGYQLHGMCTSPMRRGSNTRVVCEKCLVNVEI